MGAPTGKVPALPINFHQIKLKTKLRIGIGFQHERASWDWIGFDTGRELSKYFDVEFFNEQNYDLSRYQVVMLVKNSPNEQFLDKALDHGCKIIFVPADNYEQPEQIQAGSRFLKCCNAILIHSERLMEYFRPYCNNVRFVEHHNRFGLTKMVDYFRAGHVVWVGGGEHLDTQGEYLRANRIFTPIKFVAGNGAHLRDGGILSIPDHNEIIEWNPKNQKLAMETARGAFDIKGNSWWQMMKPAVKAQKFIMSGLPMAVNKQSPSYEYFTNYGLNLCEPSDTERWFSFEYFQECQRVGVWLKEKLALERVVLDFYKQAINDLTA